MKQTLSLSPDIQELIETAHYYPAISIIMPFEPKMGVKAELSQRLKYAVDKVESDIRKNYSDELATLVIRKLRALVKTLNFSTFKKSIAIYVSPVLEKVLYLDIAVEERIIIDESFEIRDLVYAKKDIHKYLVVVLSGKSFTIFIGNTDSFIKIKSNIPQHIAALADDESEKTGNFSDASAHREVVLKKFLEQGDKGLSFVLQSYQLPVLILGTKKVLGYFKGITKNEKNIIGYVHGNYERASEPELSTVLQPYIQDWKKVKIRDLSLQLERAADTGKLVIGMKEVWRQASLHKGRLLVIEKNFIYPAEHTDNKETIEKLTLPYNKFSYIKDAVDDAIEKVLEYGGDVEFVDEGVLKDHIALIQYY